MSPQHHPPKEVWDAMLDEIDLLVGPHLMGDVEDALRLALQAAEHKGWVLQERRRRSS